MSDAGRPTDGWGRPYPAGITHINVREAAECPACLDRGGYIEEPAGYYRCCNCHSVWAGDPDNAELLEYNGPDVETNPDTQGHGGEHGR